MFGNRDKWNNLPQCCINCTTLNNFKSHIHKVLEPESEFMNSLMFFSRWGLGNFYGGNIFRENYGD